MKRDLWLADNNTEIQMQINPQENILATSLEA
jgi:hypothetical protein